MNNKSMIWILALAAGGGALYFYMKNKAANGGAILPAPGISLPVTSAPPLTATPLQIAPAAFNLSLADQYAYLQSWANGGSDAHRAMITALQPGDIPVLYQIVHDYFNSEGWAGSLPSSLQEQWNRIARPYGLA